MVGLSSAQLSHSPPHNSEAAERVFCPRFLSSLAFLPPLLIIFLYFCCKPLGLRREFVGFCWLFFLIIVISPSSSSLLFFFLLNLPSLPPFPVLDLNPLICLL